HTYMWSRANSMYISFLFLSIPSSGSRRNARRDMVPFSYTCFIASLQSAACIPGSLGYDTPILVESGMRRIVVGLIIVAGFGAAAAVSNFQKQGPATYFPREERNPVTHLRWNEADGDFQFAIVSDRTGGHRANIFAQAVHKLNLLQPAFVVSVGDLIEGGKKTDAQYQSEWAEFDGFVSKLTMPFFYVAGNHDTGVKESAKFWDDKLGRRHYNFVYP